MTYHPSAILSDQTSLPELPGWVSSGQAETLEDMAFRSGAVLAQLHLVLGHKEVPQALMRDRLALRAAEACVVFAGRPERASDLRDEICLLRPEDQPGPAGQICMAWRQAAERPVSGTGWHRAVPEATAEQAAAWLDAGQGGRQGAPVPRAAQVIETVLADNPRAEAAALILADAALAQALGWTHLVPLLAGGLKPRDLRATGDDLRRACHRAIAESAAEAVHIGIDLARRVCRLRAVAPKLRAKGADRAVQMFLTRDAVAASTLPLPDRAARRLCARLVATGAVRELTGRDTFRLYGV